MRKQNPPVAVKTREATKGELGNTEGAKLGWITKANVVARLLGLADLPPERTRGNIIGQVQALKAIAEIEGYGVSRCDPAKELANRTVEDKEFFATNGYWPDEVGPSQPCAAGPESQS